MPRWVGLLAAGWWVLSLGGCLPPQASFEWGLGTGEIHGTLAAQPGTPKLEDPLIVIYKHHYTFMPRYASSESDSGPDPFAEGTLTHPSAHVLQAGNAGLFSISMPADVVAISALFVAPGRLTRVFRFSRSLGLGRIRYEARLPVMEGWRDHFYTFLEPQLQHLIVDGRYRLSNREQQLLGAWLRRRKEALEGPSQAAPPANPG